YQIEDMAHTTGPQGVDPVPVICLGSKLGIEGGGIGHIVSMRAARHRRQIRRGVTIADAQRVKVLDDRLRIVESERLVELQSIRRVRNSCERHQPNESAS